MQLEYCKYIYFLDCFLLYLYNLLHVKGGESSDMFYLRKSCHYNYGE